MMKAVRLLIINSLLIILAACNGGAGGDESIKVNTGGIFNPVSLSFNNVEIQPIHDLGEFLLGTPKKVFAFQVRNNSLYYIQEVKVTLEGFSSFGFKFNKDPNGVSAYPGYLGTCTGNLSPGGICTVVLQFETSIKGQYDQDITFHYKNLVEETSRPLKLLILAGNAASLVFDGEETNYVFGEKVGLGQVPVVEKEDKVVLEKTLNVTNAGDLKAREIKLTLAQTCSSELTGECPAGLGNAYSFTTNCPDKLLATESCQATIRFAPRNFDVDINNPNLEFAQVRFASSVKYDYLNSMEPPNNKAALNAYFTSVSTRIEGNFKTSIDTLPFETQVTVGNRLQKSVRINNKGFREGQLRNLIIERAGVNIGWCVRESTSLYMNCFANEALSTPLSLASFPFYFRDKNSCFGTTALNDGNVIEVDGGCQLDLYFQPSVTYKATGSSAFKLKTRYDSHWKDQETLKNNFLLDSSGTYLAAARLVPEKISYAGKVLPYVSLSALNDIVLFDLGRIGMMSPNSFKRKTMEITFLNSGDVTADAVFSTDGWGLTIPKKEDNALGIPLKPSGGDNKPLYADAKISTAYCNQIPPGGRCTIAINFAPIAKSSVEETRTYAFDHLDAVDPLKSYKSFFFNYQDGSQFTDGNRTEVKDSGAASAQAQMKAVYVAKGILNDFNKINLIKDGGPHPYELVTKTYAIVSNIGTDKVRYMGYTGDNKFTAATGVKIVASDLSQVADDHDGELFGPLKDCKDLIDFNYLPTTTCAIANAKIQSGLGFLGPDETCALTFERSLTYSQYKETVTHELARLNIKAFMGTPQSWEYDKYEVYLSAMVDFYDNDVSNPSPVGTLGSCLGSVDTTDFTQNSMVFLGYNRIIPHTPYPNASAVLYRKGYTLPELRDPANALIKSPFVIPDMWFFSPSNIGDLSLGVDLDADIVTSAKSKDHFPAQVNISPLDLSNYDYVVHLGTFPVGQTVSTGFFLSSAATALQGVWKGSSSTTIMQPPGSTAPSPFGYAFSIPMNTNMPGNPIKFPATGDDVRMNFLADMGGTYASEFTYSYKNGDYLGTPASPVTVTQKILVIAEAINDAPDISVKTATYKVVTDGFSAPTLTPSGPNGFVAGDYSVYNAASGDLSNNDWITSDAVKIPSPLATDYYVRKQILITNKSSTLPLTEFKLLAKASPSATAATSLNFGTNIKFCFDGSAAQCKGTCSGVTTLAPGASCYFEIYYQPNETQISKDLTVSAIYKMQSNQYFNRSIRFSFIPKDPAILTAVGKVKDSVRVNLGNIQSYAMDLLTDKEITTDPQIIAFDKSSGTTKRIQVVNGSLTRASFLKAYHEFKGTTNVNTIPSAGDYNYVSDGISYALIYQKNYTSGQPRIQVYANKECLVGGATAEDDALALFQKGFNSAVATPCYLAVVLKANSHYMNIDLVTATAVLMEPNHVRLPYYDNDRSSFSYFNVHFIGKLKPNGSSGVPNNATAYTSVLAGSNGAVSFKWQEMIPKNSALGNIVGYRVYYSTSQSALDNTYLITASKVDDFNVPNATGIYQMTQTGLTAKKYYYYRVVPIRQYASYNSQETFPGIVPFNQLTGNRYLSETLVPKMGVVVPPPDMFFDYDSQLLIYRNVKTTDLMTIAQARTACTSITKLRLSRSGANADFTNRLITQAAWDKIVLHADESTYPIFTLTAWLDGSTQNIHTRLLPMVGYSPTDEAKYLPAYHVFYQKTNLCQPNCTGDKAVGTVYHNPEYGGYESYISTGYVYGSPRCHVNLNSP